MKIVNLVIIVLISSAASLYVGSRYYYYSPFYHRVTHATAVIHPTKGNSAEGIVNFAQRTDGVQISAQLSGLTAGEHGFHIHEFGDCGCDDAVCAGSHFNPTNEPHAGPQNPKRHSGDMGNIIADQDGNAQLEFIDSKMQLNGPCSIIGRAVIVHEKRDDLVSQPTGDAGARIGCGTIGIRKNS